MLKAKKSVWFERLFSVYNRNLLKRRFDSFRVRNFESLFARDIKIPLIIYANHSSWWDGLVLFEILKNSNFDSYVLMEEKQLAKLSAFRRLGAFSIVREKPKQAVESLDYAVKILNSGEKKTLLIFPQGEIAPNDKRPLHFYNGLEYIARKSRRCNLIPCSIRYEFLGEFKPEILLSFGDLQESFEIEKSSRKHFTKTLEQSLTTNLDDLKITIIEDKLEDFQRKF